MWGRSLLTVMSDRTRGKGLRLHQGRLSLDIGEYFCTKRAAQGGAGILILGGI